MRYWGINDLYVNVKILQIAILYLILRNMINIRNINNTAIIMLFAALHFGVAAISRALEIYDDIILTILTITMVIIISMRNNSRVELIAIMTLVVTLLGYVIGSWFQQPLTSIINNGIYAPAISTLIVTATLGLMTDYVTNKAIRFKNRERNFSFSSLKILSIALSILILRMIYISMDRALIFTEGMVLKNIIHIISNSWSLLPLLACNIALSIHTIRNRNIEYKNSLKTILKIAFFTLLISLTTTAIIYFDIPQFNHPNLGYLEFIRVFSSVLLIDLIILTFSYIITIYIDSQRELREERELKHRSEYRYARLKQQITPHFLFNSLSILDYLVQEHQTERASAFIHKFAGIYRYMLNNDQKDLVKLSEELDFTIKYIDLLKERFTEGIIFEIEIDKELLDNFVVPCSLQLLVENAAKHNIVCSDTPLRVKITTENSLLVVSNNLQPRTHGQPSTHLGLENIRQQYIDITRHDISIEKSDTEFIVKLPIV